MHHSSESLCSYIYYKLIYLVEELKMPQTPIHDFFRYLWLFHTLVKFIHLYKNDEKGWIRDGTIFKFSKGKDLRSIDKR